MVMNGGDEPGSDQQRGRADDAGNVGGDDEDAGADHRAHHDGGGARGRDPCTNCGDGCGADALTLLDAGMESRGAVSIGKRARKLARHGFGSRRRRKRPEMTATESAPASMTLRALSRVMPPMATRGFAGEGAGAADTFEADDGLGVGLGSRWQRRGRWRGSRRRRASAAADLRFGMGGDADDAVGPRLPRGAEAGVFGREIVLADMDAVEVGEEGEVGAVVHERMSSGRRLPEIASRSVASGEENLLR